MSRPTSPVTATLVGLVSFVLFLFIFVPEIARNGFARCLLLSENTAVDFRRVEGIARPRPVDTTRCAN